MTDEASIRYTLDEAVAGLKYILSERAGKDQELTFEPDSRIDAVVAECYGASADDVEEILDYFYLCLLPEIERYFRPDVSSIEWGQWLYADAKSQTDWHERIAPLRTMKMLAAILVLRSRKVSFEPVTILGRRCAPAGAFRGAEKVAGEVDPAIEKFGPSTPIRDRLRGSKLSEFWNRVRMCSGQQIPAVVDPSSHKHPAVRRADIATLLLLPLLITETVFWIGFIPRGFVETSTLALAGMALGLFLVINARVRIGRVFAYFSNPLPQGIHTFRDLAELIVRARQPFETTN